MAEKNKAQSEGEIRELAAKMGSLLDRVQKETASFSYSTEVLKAESDRDLSLGIKDLLVICAVARTNVIITGATRTGKTALTTGVLYALFGSDNVAYLSLDAGFDENRFRNINFEKMKGSTLKDASEPTKAVTGPAVIFDEMNRAPEQVTNILHPWLAGNEIVFNGGKGVVPGVTMPHGGTYQFCVAIANVGNDYSGTFAMDRAAINRFPVEIPIDHFPRTDNDRLEFLRNTSFRERISCAGNREAVLELAERKMEIKLDPAAENLLVRLMRQDQCIKSPDGVKSVMTTFRPGATCSGCHAYANDMNMCGNVWAPGEGTVAKIADLARAYALVRIARKPETELQVMPGDVKAVMPIALYGKLCITPAWVAGEPCRGSWMEATKHVTRQIYSGWRESNAELLGLEEEVRRGATAEEINKRMTELAMDRPSMLPLGYVKRAYDELRRGEQKKGAV
jgi:MoxR-like ATPase